MLNVTTPFPYKSIKRITVDGRRLYDTETGPLPSVTTILDKTKSAEKQQVLANWRKRVGDTEAQRITTEAANTGTVMHAILENWVNNVDYNPGNNLIHQQAKAMAEVVKTNVSADLNEVWGNEVSLYYPGVYAGTADLLGVWKGYPTIMDFKQTNKPKKREWIEDYFLQCAAYALAHNQLWGTTIDRAAIFMCSRDCQWQLFEVEPDEFKVWEDRWVKRVEQYYNL